MFRRRSTKKGLRAAEAAAAANAASDNIDDNDTITQTSLSRKPTKKKGVMRRVFSFKRNTSASNFHAEAGESEDANDIFPEMVVGHATDLGFNHPDNEDRCNVILDLFTDAPQEEAKYVGTSDRRLAVFTVFDGHGGKTCSDFACKNLYKELGQLMYQANYHKNVGTALHHSFKVTENKWCERAKSANDTAGSCSTAVVVKGSQVYCGNAGDSKALLFQINETHGVNPVELNERHGTNLKSERKRILAAGGKIAPDGSVYGVLFPSRGFGDIDVKADGKPVVICTPNGAGIDDWQPHRLEHSEATWLVVASDGLWDFVVDDQVMSIVAKNQHLDHSAIAKKLIDEARLCGSEDDITIIVVRFSFPEPGPRLSTVAE